jgi:hypothetical protein
MTAAVDEFVPAPRLPAPRGSGGALAWWGLALSIGTGN